MIVLVVDPVCGTEIDEQSAASISVYRGEPYYFCCAGCHAVFDENPEKYVAEPAPAEEQD